MDIAVTDSLLLAVARLVDDSGATREPSHSEIEFQIDRARLHPGDPSRASGGTPVGKAKRVRATLSWALEHNPDGAGRFVEGLLALLRAAGGFRPTSGNYVGIEAIANAKFAFRIEGYELADDGELRPTVLENLSGAALTTTLQAYVRRAKRGAEDAALVTGTSKDLLEATAAHVIVERFGTYPQSSNFPTLLGQAFIALGMATPQDPPVAGELPQRRVERAMFELACAVNALRNKAGIGHGRPWPPNITDADAKAAIELMGIIAETMLGHL